MHIALEYFTDNLDNGHAYNVGDEYPRQGYEPSEKRIQQLASSDNVRHRPVIGILSKDDEKAITEAQEAAETVATVAAEETAENNVDNIPDNDFGDIDEKPKKRRKREE